MYRPGNDEWKAFVKANYTQLGVETMAYMLGVTRSEILKEFPYLKGKTPAKPLQTLLVVRPRKEATEDET